MASVFDIAQYINDQFWRLSKVKLQKLLYFAQAWSLAMYDMELFPDDFAAWEKGPAVKSLHDSMRGSEKIVPVDIPDADISRLTNGEMRFLDAVVEYYGDKSRDELVDIAHQDSIWKNSLRDAVISKESIKALYKARECPLDLQ